MDVMQAIHTRASVTSFRPAVPDRDAVMQLLDGAVRAPNHRLTEPWGFYVLGESSKQRFAELRRDNRARRFEDPEAPEARPALEKAYAGVMETPVIIAVSTVVADDPVQREEDYAATFCAIQNILLAAVSQGLGTYLRTGDILDEPALAELLDLPEGNRVVGIIYLGYPANEPKPRRRTPAAEKTRWLD
ncbi:MAG: nitroreductase [Gemmatimonadales bacterium]|jgi:nitroreductase